MTGNGAKCKCTYTRKADTENFGSTNGRLGSHVYPWRFTEDHRVPHTDIGRAKIRKLMAATTAVRCRWEDGARNRASGED